MKYNHSKSVPGHRLGACWRLAGAALLAMTLLGDPRTAAAQAAAPAAAATVGTPAAVPPVAAPVAQAQPAAASAPVGAPPAAAPAAPGAPPVDGAAATSANARGIDQQVQDLKKSVVDLNRDLFVLEEELLFPANTQVAVFVSVDVGEFFALDSVSLRVDDREVAHYLYTPREIAALSKGGVQRLYVGNVKAGSHELVAFFEGKGVHDRYYRRGASLKFDKGVGAKYLELKITDHARTQQPEFEIKDWE